MNIDDDSITIDNSKTIQEADCVVHKHKGINSLMDLALAASENSTDILLIIKLRVSEIISLCDIHCNITILIYQSHYALRQHANLLLRAQGSQEQGLLIAREKNIPMFHMSRCCRGLHCCKQNKVNPLFFCSRRQS